MLGLKGWRVSRLAGLVVMFLIVAGAVVYCTKHEYLGLRLQHLAQVTPFPATECVDDPQLIRDADGIVVVSGGLLPACEWRFRGATVTQVPHPLMLSFSGELDILVGDKVLVWCGDRSRSIIRERDGSVTVEHVAVEYLRGQDACHDRAVDAVAGARLIE